MAYARGMLWWRALHWRRYCLTRFSRAPRPSPPVLMSSKAPSLVRALPSLLRSVALSHAPIGMPVRHCFFSKLSCYTFFSKLLTHSYVFFQFLFCPSRCRPFRFHAPAHSFPFLHPASLMLVCRLTRPWTKCPTSKTLGLYQIMDGSNTAPCQPCIIERKGVVRM